MPELAPDEAVIAVMASSINFNTVWTSIFEPLPTFGFLKRLGQESVWGARHDQPFHVVGSDASGVVLRVGSAVRTLEARRQDRGALQLRRRPGPELAQRLDAGRQPADLGVRDELRRPGRSGDRQGQPAHAQAGPPQLGGGRGQRAVQLDQLPHAGQPERGRHDARATPCSSGARPAVWAATPCSTCSTAAARRSAWSRRPRRATSSRALGCEAVIDRKAAGYKFWADEFHQDESEWRRLGKDVRALIGRDPDIVFEHPGRQTFGASVFVAARGGKIVTCAATSGYMIEYDNRHLWMKLKRIISSHFANYAEAWAANQLICEGKIQPILSAVHPLDEVGEAAYQVHHNLHEGKIGVLCLAPSEGLGIDDPAFREQVGEDKHHAVPQPRGPRRRHEPAHRTHARRRSRRPGQRRVGPGRSAAHRDRPRRHRRATTSAPPSTTTARRSAPSSTTARWSRATASRRRC